MKKIGILGSTGSIGTQTLEIVRANGDLKVVILAAGSNASLMEIQAREFMPEAVVMYDEKAASDLKIALQDTNIKVLSGMEGLLEVSVWPGMKILLTALVGMIGIRPTIAAIEAGIDIALANKETLVTAGHIIMPRAKQYGVNILPVDSEHSAIFQSMQGEKKEQVSKILLTASGGPFRGKSTEQLQHIQVEDALKHPNWVMGRKITIDSATLMNKGLEVIEAKWLFDMPLDRIQVVVHPQSVIHSMVEYADGGIIAQLGTPDMKLPIQYALYYPDRLPLAGDRLNFYQLGTMTFEAPDTQTFKGLALAYEASTIGGSMPTVFNAANERAVALFLERKIGFLEIAEMVERCMQGHTVILDPTVEEILDTERRAYEAIQIR